MDTSNKEVDAAMAALRSRALGSTDPAVSEAARRRLGRILFVGRLSAGLTMQEITESYGPAESTISAVERGERVPNKVTMLALLDVYREHCDIGVLNSRVWVSPR